MSFTIAQLKALVAISEELHFGRAAERLSITQPSLTRNIQNLERVMKVPLVERGGRDVSLTQAGEAVLANAKRILSIAESTPTAARLAASGEVGVLRLAFTAIGAYSVLGEFLTKVNELFPSVRIRLVEMVSESQFEALARGSLDLALARPPVPESLRSTLIHSEDMVLAVPAGHRLAQSPGPLSLKDALDDGYIAYSRTTQKYFHDMCATMLNMDQFLASHSVSQIPTMLALVRAQRGIALVPSSATLLNVDGVVYRRLEAIDARSVSLHACWDVHNSNPALKRLIPHLEAMFPFVGLPKEVADSITVQPVA